MSLVPAFSQSIDICSGWQPRDGRAVGPGRLGPPAPSPLTIVFGGNGAGKSAIFDAVFFVLGQSAKSMRSSGGSAQLVNEQTVLQKGPNAAASVTITFHKSGRFQEEKDAESGDDGHVCSRATMMQKLNAFVGADMGDVDRYVLKQGSTMVCRREGKELLSFIERLAGTAKLKADAEEVQTALDTNREEALSLQADVQASTFARKELQPQVQAFVLHQREVTEFRQEETGLWHKQLASLRQAQVHHDELETEVAKSETEATILRSKIKWKKAKGKALARAHKLLEEGDAEIAKLSAQAYELDSVSKSMKARILELEFDAESAKLREYCASQQALASSLEARRTVQEASSKATKRLSRDSTSRASTRMNRRTSSGGPFSAPNARGRATALRSLIEGLHDSGSVGDRIGVHGMLADLVLLRRQGDEAAVSAVLGPALRNTVVVQTRRDGARVVAEVREAGFPWQVRCDVLDEISAGTLVEAAAATAAAERRQKGAGSSRLRSLSMCVTTSDPQHFAAAEKHLRGWLVAETRQAAWSAKDGPSNSSAATNLVTMSEGELFFASGEVAVKGPKGSFHAPRLRVARDGQQQHQRQQGDGSPPLAHQQQVNERGQDIELRLKETLGSLSTAETRLDELARKATRARFDYEDAQVRHATAQTTAKEYHREMLRMDKKVSVQHRLISASKGCGNGKGPAADDTDEVQLRNLQERRDKIVAELAEGDASGLRGAGSIDFTGRAAALRELRNLRTEIFAGRELQDEVVEVKLRVLAKRGTARRDRLEALEAEKKDSDAQQKLMKARQLLHEKEVAALLITLEEAKSVCKVKREATRQKEGAARKAKRELSALGAARWVYSPNQ
ncbi:unnamed protein product, partial [Hapterophycus canaliculatus]